MFQRKVMVPPTGVGDPQSIDFNGSSYLSRTGALTGISDTSTFTISLWFYATSANQDTVLQFADGATNRFRLTLKGSNFIEILATASNNSTLLNASVSSSTNMIALNTFNHLLISVDLNNTSNRGITINRQAMTVNWTTYNPGQFVFSAPNIAVGSNTAGTDTFFGRLSNLFFDTEYRDVSLAATQDMFTVRNPAVGLVPNPQQANLNPDIFVLFDEPTEAHINSGTGGDFVQNGSFTRSGRGPNQYNAPATRFTSTASWLRNTNLTVTDATTFTLNLTFQGDLSPSSRVLFGGAGNSMQLRTDNTNNVFTLTLRAWGTDGNLALEWPISTSVGSERYYSLQVSIDMNNQSNSRAILNGTAVSTTPTTFTTGQTLNLSDNYGVAGTTSSVYQGVLSELWYNNTFVDLTSSNPFYDQEPLFLGFNGERPTGTSPIVYMPLHYDTLATNFGTGSNFVEQGSATNYEGARSPNEFWVKSLSNTRRVFPNTQSDHFAFSDFIEQVNSPFQDFSLVIFARSFVSSLNGQYIFGTGGTNVSGAVSLIADTSESVIARVGSVSSPFSISNRVFDTDDWVLIFLSRSNSSIVSATAKYDQDSPTFTVRTRDITNPLNSRARAQFLGGFGSSNFPGEIALGYLANQYIDFSQEANRQPFLDGLNYPENLTTAIANGEVPSPWIYTPFQDDNLLANLGTVGGVLTPQNATLAPGGDVRG